MIDSINISYALELLFISQTELMVIIIISFSPTTELLQRCI